MAKEKMAVATIETKGTAVMDAGLADVLGQLGGIGIEEAGAKDFALPFIKQMQALSPQINKRKAEYVEGAEVGDLIDSVTGEIFKAEEGMTLIPCYFNKKYLEYRPRANGGGFVAVHDTEEDARSNQQAGNEIVETANHYVLYLGKDGRWRPAVLSMTVTKLKVSRKWLSTIKDVRVNGREVPSFAKQYRVTSIPETNKKGDEYFQLKIEDAGWVPSAQVLAEAKSFYENMVAGDARADFAKAETVAAETDTGRSF